MGLKMGLKMGLTCFRGPRGHERIALSGGHNRLFLGCRRRGCGV
jgi:hypothetical protein